MILVNFKCLACGEVLEDVDISKFDEGVAPCVVCDKCGEVMVKEIGYGGFQEHGSKGLKRFMRGLPGRPD